MGSHTKDHLQPARPESIVRSRQSPLSGVSVHHRGSTQRTRQTRQTSQPVIREGRAFPRFNLFDTDDEALFQTILRGEFNISGLQNKLLRRLLRHLNSGQVSRLLKRLRLHG